MRQNSREPRSALPALTSIRFFAALWVVVSHLAVMGYVNFSAPVRWVAGDSRPAVTFFFVLSGFILAHNYGDGLDSEGIRRFYVARFARIYPMLVFSLMLAAPVTAILLISDDHTHLFEWYGIPGNPLLPLITSLVAQLLGLTAWLPFAAVNQPWDGPTWSISCEAFFYLAFPLLVAFIKRLTAAQRGMVLLAGFCAQGLWIVALLRFLPLSRSGFLVSQFPLTHLFEFALGIGVQCYCRELQRGARSYERGARVASLLAILAIGVLSVWRPIEPAYYLLSPCFALLVGSIAMQKQPAWGLLNVRPMVLLGEASFSLYLIHVPLIHLAELAGVGQRGALALLAGMVALSVILFVSIERPMRSAILRRYAQRAAPAPSPAMTA
ncbi:acyltransferase family protein [Paraburkholderia sp. BCC1885]|uniref:acyltransferase family protein n=1 Tax=Paraburkholderia sp. BCC1885 TaxID=2562669 RepID=UPI001182C49A|nr:acyltransferase [Paraburkholderia sp. BCC1885]